jgi:hypothetical protein
MGPGGVALATEHLEEQIVKVSCMAHAPASPGHEIVGRVTRGRLHDLVARELGKPDRKAS